MPGPETAALEHYTDRRELVTAAADIAASAWQQVDTDRIAASWAAQVPELAVLTSGAQLAAAGQADSYLDALSETPAPTVVADRFAGVASDGRPLGSLLTQPAITALQAIGAGLTAAQALRLGGQHLDTIVRTQVADAGRAADQVALTARRDLGGYVRVVVGRTCSRCTILAGRFYAWSAGFRRHPRCDCIHLPSTQARAAGLRQNPRTIYDSLSPQERQQAGWSLADQRAIDDGADLNKVTNLRGVTTSGSHRSAGRMTPEQIYREARDRDEAIRLLRLHGYLR